MGLRSKTARPKDVIRVVTMLKMAFGHAWEIGHSSYEIEGKPQYTLDLRQRRKHVSKTSSLALSIYLTELTIHYSNIGYTLH